VLAEADVGWYGRFWVAAPKEVLVLAFARMGDGDSHGCHRICWRHCHEVCASLSSMVSPSEGNLRSSASGDGGIVHVVLTLGASSRSQLLLGASEGWYVAEVADRGRCMQFGNDDAASNVWVVAWASIVGPPTCQMSFYASLCCCEVEAVVECAHAATMWATSLLWRTRSAQA
jgi:hypothetical protein